MRNFHELKVGDKFTFQNKTYVKAKEQRVSCCKIKKNAVEVETNKDVVIPQTAKVQKIDE